VQQVVRSPLVALSGVMDPERGLLGATQQVAGRTWPLDAGVTAHGRTVPVDAGLLEGVERLLRALGWSGLAQVQFIGERPHVIDLNGRLYGSLALAVAAGANLPALGVGAGPDAGPARAGVAYQWLEGDLRAARASGEGMGAVLRRAARAAHSVWDPRDPAPAARTLGDLPRRLMAARAAGVREDG
jgi:hypothetical protein